MASAASIRLLIGATTRGFKLLNVSNCSIVASTSNRSFSTGHFLKSKDGPIDQKDANRNNETVASVISTETPSSSSSSSSSSTAATSTGPAVVYSGTMNDMVYNVKHFSLFTSVLILGSQPFVFGKMSELDSVILKSAVGGGLAFFFLGTPLLIHSFTKKYVIEMTLDRDGKIFEATTYSFFLRKKKIRFYQSDIEIPDKPLPFTTIKAKGTSLFFIPDGWKSRFAYDHLMLLDKQTVDWSQIKESRGEND